MIKTGKFQLTSLVPLAAFDNLEVLISCMENFWNDTYFFYSDACTYLKNEILQKILTVLYTIKYRW